MSSERACEREREVVAAVSGGTWTAALRSHTEACPSCAEASAVAAAMQRIAADAIASAPTPPPYRIVWLRADYRRRERSRARRALATTLVQAGLAAACAVALFPVIGLSLGPRLVEAARSGTGIVAGGGPILALVALAVAWMLSEGGTARSR
jgi:hypothetical protein